MITNKATPEEQEGIPHHLLGFLDPFSETNVVDFQARAQHAIDGILEKGKVCRKNHKKKLKPKVCKYTHTQALLCDKKIIEKTPRLRGRKIQTPLLLGSF